MNDPSVAGRLGITPFGDVRAPASAPAIEPLLIDLETAARLLGISPRSVKRQVADGQLPGVVRQRRRVLFRLAALRQWVENGCPPVRGGKRR